MYIYTYFMYIYVACKDACHAFEYVMSKKWRKSCNIHQGVRSHVVGSRATKSVATHIQKSSHTYEGVM